MAKQEINIGYMANDGHGDGLRTSFAKINDNFTELYSQLLPNILNPNIAYTGIFNGYPVAIPVTKGQAIYLTETDYVLETTNMYWMSKKFDTYDYDLSGTETLDFNNIGGINDYFRLGGKSEILLTDVNLKDIIAIADYFYLRDLAALENFSANNLSYVGGYFKIDTMDNVNTQFNFPNLKIVKGDLYYTNNTVLENTPQFPALENINSLQIYYNHATQNTMTFDSLKYLPNAGIWQNNGMLAGPEFPALTVIDYFYMNNNDYMIDPPTFPLVHTMNGPFYFDGNENVTSAPAFPSLVTGEYFQVTQNPSMVDGFDFSSLVTLNSTLYIIDNPSLTESPTFPLLQTIDGGFTLSNSPLLTSGLSFPALKTLNGDFDISGCGFDETTINSILIKLASLDGTNGTTSYNDKGVYVNFGTNFWPTGDGLTAIATLESRGCVVYYNLGA